MRPVYMQLCGWFLAAATQYGLNVLDGKLYPHHPVMLAIPERSFPIEPGILIEWSGLRVPARLDCPNLCNQSAKDKNQCGLGREFSYYRDVPSRRQLCHEHEAYVMTGLSHRMVGLPLIDDDYGEHVAVYQSVLRHPSQRSFRVVELGARWGTWGARAVALLRQLKQNVPHEALFVESDKLSCKALRWVMHLNHVNYRLLCDYATPKTVLSFLKDLEFIDLVHIDIQGYETELLSSSDIRQILDKVVARIVVGTHSMTIHTFIAELYKDWIPIFELPRGDVECIYDHLGTHRGRGAKVPSASAWQMLREKQCFHLTPQGGVVNWDGLLILDNPSFVDAAKAFSLSDSELRINDLMH